MAADVRDIPPLPTSPKTRLRLALILSGVVALGVLLAAQLAPTFVLTVTVATISITAFMMFYAKAPDELGLGPAMRRAIAGSVVLSYLVFFSLAMFTPSIASPQRFLNPLTAIVVAVVIFYFASEGATSVAKAMTDRANAATDQAIIEATQDAQAAKSLKIAVSAETEASTAALRQAQAAKRAATIARHNANQVEDRLVELEDIVQLRGHEDFRTAFDRYIADRVAVLINESVSERDDPGPE